MKYSFKISLFLFLFILFSCSNDDKIDENNMSHTELIFGDWQLNSQVYLSEDGTETLVELDECQMMQLLSFSDNFIYTGFRHTGDNCEVITEYTGTYSFLSEDTFEIISGGLTIIGSILNIDENNLTIIYNESLTKDSYIKQ